jgi:VEFS-Box of polycomb protein
MIAIFFARQFHLLVKQVEQQLDPRFSRPTKKNQTEIIYCRNSPLHSTIGELPAMSEVIQTGVALPTRQYYRDLTFTKIGISEWFFDLKDEEVDPNWQGIVDDSVSGSSKNNNETSLIQLAIVRLHTYCFCRSQALCELTDVSAKEKHFFLLWNKFMRTNPILSQIQLPSQLRTFVREHSRLVCEHDLEDELIAHITNMWCEGVIGRWNMLECMRIYNGYVAERRASARTRSPRRTAPQLAAVSGTR